MRTVLIYSGGMDSTTLLYKLLNDGDYVEAVSFNYGQRHNIELKQAAKTCKRLKVPHTIVDISFIKKLVSNSALTGKIKVPHGHYEAENMKLTVVPNRNMIMASIAIGYAVNKNFDRVAMGVHAGDHAIYPDCRPEFIRELNHVAKIANFKPIEIYAPFLKWDKGDIAIKGKELGVDYSLTHTCYEGKAKPCGKCGACQERKEAFSKANTKDPLTK